MNRPLLLFILLSLCSYAFSAPEETVASETAKSKSAIAEGNLAPKASLKEIKAFISNNEFSSAYALGLSMLPDWEGNEEFDFNFALSAAQVGKYNHAIFSFERLVLSYPNNTRFRIELARCHFFLKNYAAAEREFTRVKESNPPKSVEDNIDRFLEKISEQKQQVTQSWGVGASIAAGYDSNINAATDLDKVDATLIIADAILKGKLDLNDEQKSKSSSYYQAQAFTNFQKPLSKRSNIDASIYISNKDNTISDTYDLSNASIDAGFRILRSNHNIRLGASYRYYWLEYKTLQSQTLANLRWQWHFSSGWNFSESVEVGQQNNDQNNSLDYYQWQSKSSIQRNILTLNQTLSLNIGSDYSIRSVNKFQGRDFFSFIYQIQKSLTDQQRLFTLVNYRNNAYHDTFDSEHIFYANEQRTDQLAQLIAGWTYSFTSSLSTKLQVSHSKNASNLELYEYDRTLIEAGLMLSFN